MTHIFSATANELEAISKGQKTFDILNFQQRAVKVGDVIIYQKSTETVFGAEPIEDSGDIYEECSATVGFVFDDVEGALKKNFKAVGFAPIQTNGHI
jgi:hypothetical protein